MSCEHCNGPGEDQKCCWAKAQEIEKFKQHVLKKFIFEVLFDLIISVISVITDIITLILYLLNGKWMFVILTAIPVILPTTVFTNIYLSDESRGYCEMPADRMKKLEKPQTEDAVKDQKKYAKARKSIKTRCTACVSHLTCGIKCTSARMCFGGMFQIFNKDSVIRKKGANAIRKSLRRSLKYFFGTFVLRFIAWTWYFKALIHGVKAYRSPKKFMKIQSPDLHWSYELLVRLDFLQAALENAPQCVVQLYALITQPDEQVTLGLLTLFFSFVDFVRVAMAVLWDIHKGPIIAPQGCYGTLTWRIINSLSWITVYAARSCSLALVFATSEGWSIGITAVGFTFHIVVFSRLFSKNKYGVATEKVAVTTFITLFFLPELNATDVEKLTQFYYAMIMFQNVFFIIPWNGIEYDYCIKSIPKIIINSTNQTGSVLSFPSSYADFSPYNTFDNDFERGNYEKNENCLIEPIVIVLLVPTCTIIGMVIRLAVANRMVSFIEQHPAPEYTMKMEERVADIYRKKWANMSIKELSGAFLKMLKKEVIQSEPEEEKNRKVALITNQFHMGFKASQSIIRKSFSMILLNRPIIERGEQHRTSFKNIDEEDEFQRKYSKHNNWASFPRRKLKNDNFQNLGDIIVSDSDALRFVTMKRNFIKPPNPFLTNVGDEPLEAIDSDTNDTETEITDVDTISEHSIEIVPQSFFTPCLQRNFSSDSSNASGDNLFPHLGVNVQTLQIDMPDGNTHILEMGWL